MFYNLFFYAQWLCFLRKLFMKYKNQCEGNDDVTQIALNLIIGHLYVNVRLYWRFMCLYACTTIYCWHTCCIRISKRLSQTQVVFWKKMNEKKLTPPTKQIANTHRWLAASIGGKLIQKTNFIMLRNIMECVSRGTNKF